MLDLLPLFDPRGNERGARAANADARRNALRNAAAAGQSRGAVNPAAAAQAQSAQVAALAGREGDRLQAARAADRAGQSQAITSLVGTGLNMLSSGMAMGVGQGAAGAAGAIAKPAAGGMPASTSATAPLTAADPVPPQAAPAGAAGALGDPAGGLAPASAGLTWRDRVNQAQVSPLDIGNGTGPPPNQALSDAAGTGAANPATAAASLGSVPTGSVQTMNQPPSWLAQPAQPSPAAQPPAAPAPAPAPGPSPEELERQRLLGLARRPAADLAGLSLFSPLLGVR